MKNKALRKVKLIEKHLVDLQNMGYDVTFNTPASIYNQILENNIGSLQSVYHLNSHASNI